MPRRRVELLALLALVLAGQAWSQPAEEDFRVSTEHPRLFLGARRLRLLVREKERQSLRWQQFNALITGKAPMPEPGFAQALYSQVSGDQAYCQQAVDWALGPGAGLRQMALVYDWCQPSSEALAAKLEQGLAASSQTGISATRDRVLAAIALGDQKQAVTGRHLELALHDWWPRQVVPAIRAGQDALPREEMLALAEILHAVHDNLGIDLRDPIEGFFRDLPLNLMLSYYPGPYQAPENEYRIPAVKGGGAPDLRRATLSRAAELVLAAYDSNLQEVQFLQGWLMRDPFLMRSALGIPYEFLWANPYLPGLSYYHAPLVTRDKRMGNLFLRSNWEEDATWLGFFDGDFQVFSEGGLKLVKPQPAAKPIRIGDAAIFVLAGPTTVRLEDADVREVFLFGLRPGASYEVKIEDEEAHQQTADPGGILAVSPEPAKSLRIRVRLSKIESQ